MKFKNYNNLSQKNCLWVLIFLVITFPLFMIWEFLLELFCFLVDLIQLFPTSLQVTGFYSSLIPKCGLVVLLFLAKK